jgi:acyl-homoserine lactone synthase
LSRRLNALARRETRNQLVSALAWYALEQKISTYTGVAEFSWLQQILAFGWNCRPLGVPIQLECGLLAALAIEIRADTPHLLRQNGVWENVGEPVLRIAEAA